MVYPSDFEEKTGFSHIRKLVASKCSYKEGKQWCEEMKFSSDFNRVKLLLLQTFEMVNAFESVDALPLDIVSDISSEIDGLKFAGGHLEPKVLRHLRATLITAETIASFFSKKNSDSGELLYPYLHKALESIETFDFIIKEIDAIISEHATVKDTASQELADIRSSLRSVSSSMSGIMRRVIDKGVASGVLERDTTPTLREGRLMLPVPATLKRSISGIVVDESSTGKTVFMEPLEIVEANNRIRKLQVQEKREIIRILVQLSDKIRPHFQNILYTIRLLGLFDFIRAKAWVARRFNASLPVLEHDPVLEWYHAVHPVLENSLKEQGREAVPLNIRLDKKDRILVISGPNAGGKSVTLKTVGINQYMLQCGMLPIMYSNSHISVFNNILLDIGDEQSIENDLSTYSSHLRNMKMFLSKADPKSLFLIDEMGSGTEPHFGGALARSILEQLNESKAMGIVTTHYSELKSFADTTEGVLNGAMLYDRQKMRPLFQLSIGSPGSSFALEIARNTGLPADVIERAKEIVGQDYVNSDKYMLDIARDRRYWANKRLAIKEKEQKIARLLENYESTAEELRQKKSKILAEARKEAADILKNSNAALEKTILEIRKAQAEKERTKELRKELQEYKEKVNDTSKDAEIDQIKKIKSRKKSPDSSKSNIATKEGDLSVGNNVIIKGSKTVGVIMSIEGNKASVAFGSLRTLVPLSQLESTLRKASTSTISKTTVAESSRNRHLNFSQELDVRGIRVDEALQAVTYFLDDAVQFNASQVRILHGTGTGALRESIRQFLQTYPAVVRFHDEDVRLGGAGITVVHLE